MADCAQIETGEEEIKEALARTIMGGSPVSRADPALPLVGG
jgi:hypothetical protein